MDLSLFDDGQTLGASNSALTFTGTIYTPPAFTAADLTYALKTRLRMNGYGFISVAFTRRTRDWEHVAFTVVIDWACNSVTEIRRDLLRMLDYEIMSTGGTAGYSPGSVVLNLTRQTGCNQGSTVYQATPPTTVNNQATPPVYTGSGSPPAAVGQTWSQWFEQNKTPIIVGSAALGLLILLRK